jgi:UDP:flavonoid glycosyltransferase YjiC (YdhE family)
LVPVLRAASKEDAFALSLTLADAGIEVLEITMTVPDAVHVIRKLRQERPHLLLGAGTGSASLETCLNFPLTNERLFMKILIEPAHLNPVAIPSNAHIASLLPYAQIMPEIDLLITNGGYGTVNMAISTEFR